MTHLLRLISIELPSS